MNFATLVHEQAVPATGKGEAGLRDELGQDSAERSWIQLPLQREGEGETEAPGPAVLGGQRAQHGH